MLLCIWRFPTTLSKAKPLEASRLNGSRVLLPPLPFLSSSPWPPGHEQGGKKIFLPNVRPLPQAVSYPSPMLPLKALQAGTRAHRLLEETVWAGRRSCVS